MRKMVNIKSYLADEAGTLLVFFAVCCATLLGILALSFDLGRRAATQSDMQSFADNVALAAAKELDGTDDATDRAKLAAVALINAANERLKAGTAGSNFTIAFDPDEDLYFYDTLPANDTPASLAVADLAVSKYTLEPSTEKGGALIPQSEVRFVGVRLDTVDVPWIFANFFSSADQPDEAIGAVAIAGNTAYTCDVAPLFFCMPRQTVGGVSQIVDMQPGWSILLRSGGNSSQGPGGGFWKPGDFGFLDISSVPIDTDGECNQAEPHMKEACLLNLIQRTNACYRNDGVDMDPGQSKGIKDAMFNMRFDFFVSTMKGLEDDPDYAPGPHTVRGIQAQQTNKTICNAQNVIPTGVTTPFYEDECFASQGGAGCEPYSYGRIGDGVWDRDRYFDANYGVYETDLTGALILDAAGDPQLIEGSGTGGANPEWNAADPSTHTYWQDRGWPAYFDAPDFPDFSFADGDLNGDGVETRYETYKQEIERATETPTKAAGVMSDGEGAGTGDQDWQKIWEPEPRTPFNYGTLTDADGDPITVDIAPILPGDRRRGDNGLPQCGETVSDIDSIDGILGADRRVFTIAGIDCDAGGGIDFSGKAKGVAVEKYYRAFLMQPVGDDGNNPPVFDIWLEIIEEIGSTSAGSTIDRGIFREVVQLYK